MKGSASVLLQKRATGTVVASGVGAARERSAIDSRKVFVSKVFVSSSFFIPGHEQDVVQAAAAVELLSQAQATHHHGWPFAVRSGVSARRARSTSQSRTLPQEKLVCATRLASLANGQVHDAPRTTRREGRSECCTSKPGWVSPPSFSRPAACAAEIPAPRADIGGKKMGRQPTLSPSARVCVLQPVP